MALPDPLALKDNAAAAKSFTRRNPVPNGNLYVATDSTSARKNAVTIRSIYSPAKAGVPAFGGKPAVAGKDAVYRNIAAFSITRVDADENEHTAVLSMSLSRPVGLDIVDADISDLYAYLAEFLVAASGDYKTRFNRGET
jgi:hypothetical protein